jgi:hypothetical protein
VREAARLILSGDHMGSEKNLLSDPGLLHIGVIDLDWIDWGDPLLAADPGLSRTPRTRSQAIFMVARNLASQSLPPMRENVVAELRRIAADRARVRSIPIFQERNVLMLAHCEMIRSVTATDDGTPYNEREHQSWENAMGGPFRFGGIHLRNAIIRQITPGRSFSFLRPKSPESAAAYKQYVLQRMLEIQPPFTFVFDGHGNAFGLYLSASNSEEERGSAPGTIVHIATDELRAMCRERVIRYPEIQSPEHCDIFVMHACRSGNTALSLARRKNEGTPLIIAASEWGQFSYSQTDDPLGTLFFSRVLNLSKPGVTTVGTVLDHEFDAIANPTIVLPGDNGKGRQIAGMGWPRTL